MATSALRKSRGPPLSKKEMAKKLCYGVFITSVWLGVNGVFWIAVQQFRHSVKLVEFDYGEIEEQFDFEIPFEEEFEYEEFV